MERVFSAVLLMNEIISSPPSRFSNLVTYFPKGVFSSNFSFSSTPDEAIVKHSLRINMHNNYLNEHSHSKHSLWGW